MMEGEFHTNKQSMSLDGEQSWTDLRVVCAVSGVRGKLTPLLPLCHPYLLEPVTKGIAGDCERLKSYITFCEVCCIVL
jgi:hypothetical protein